MAHTRKKARAKHRAAKGSSKKKPATKKRIWNDKKNEKLAKLYPEAPWEKILKAFPQHSKGALQSQAMRLNLKRQNPNYLRDRSDIEEAGSAKREPPTEEAVAAFMTCGRSVDEIAKKFHLSRENAQGWIENGLKEYELFVGPNNLRNEQTYVAVPKFGSVKVSERVWTFQRQKDGQPYGVVSFPDDFIHRKIKIVPLDSILFGDPAHDEKRFEAVIRKISRSPNMFCFLNGDIIAHVTRGKKDMKEQILLERCAEFARKMKPIAHKILWAQQGCLEERALRLQSFDPLQYFCELYEIPYFTEPVYIDLLWRGHTFMFWAMHGHSTAQVKGAKMNALRRPAKPHEFTHFMLMGHIGDTIWNRVPKLVRNPVDCKIESKEEFHMILAAFKKYFGTRAARRGHTPSSNTDVMCVIYPDGDHHVKTMSERRSR